MLNKLVRASLVASLLAAAGVHWAVLQSVAWASMLAGEVRHAPLNAAVSRTFDGRHLCSLCKTIRKGAQSERKQKARTAETRLELHFEPDRLWIEPVLVARAALPVSMVVLPGVRSIDVPPPKPVLS